jgi:type I restriction enzyme R subunit
MTGAFTESVVEDAALDWLHELGYAIALGPEILPGEPGAEREKFEEAFLPARLRAAIERLNPDIPADALDEAYRRVTRIDTPLLVDANHNFHSWLVNGISVEYARKDGTIAGDLVRLVDFEDLKANDFLAVNQFTMIEGQHNRRPDIVVFVNGLPVGVLELKNAAGEAATIKTAFNQIQTYKAEVPALFTFNEVIVVSDGIQAKVGTFTADWERFMPWRTIEGQDIAPATQSQLEVLLKGVFDRRRFLDLLQHFVVFEGDGTTPPAKKMAGYHQFHAVQVAVEKTVAATRGDRRAGVVWHTQGSGKSLTMAFYTGRVVAHEAMQNPTVIVLTDRIDLDGQLFGTFARCKELFRQDPVQATDRADLREKLKVASGGVVFTTIQKFFPEERGDKHPLLSDRRNIVVIADEAHRSQYDFIDGFARHLRDALPSASFIGFTGTPIELGDKNTRAVFGDYISVYDIQRAVEDGATVPIYYESRLASIALDERERPKLDPEFEEITEGEEEQRRERLRTKWAAIEALVGTEKRLALIAKDLVEHFDRRLEAMDGKAMIVCMSRRICVDLYEAIRKLRPQWHHEDDDTGALKIVMTGSASDPVPWQQHIRNKPRRERLSKRFKDDRDPFKIVLVRDMWLTGFDAPCLHTMYVDKPMRGHGLMQAIARVNRVFHDKPGGLVVDYLGLADQLKKALKDYTESHGEGRPTIDQQEAVALVLEKHEIVAALFHGFDWSKWTTGTPGQRLSLLPAAQEHILRQQEGKERLLREVTALSQAFALAVPHPNALALRDDISFFQAVRAALAKTTGAGGDRDESVEQAIRQLVSRAMAPGKVIDIFAAAGIKKPDISILSDQFLAEVQGLPQKNLAVELLRRLLADELKTRSKRNLVQSRSFAEMLEKAVRAYQNRALETAKIIEELIKLAKEMREATRRGQDLGLTDDEVAFYDALEVSDSAVKVLGDEKLRVIARELLDAVRRNVTIDWTERQSARAKIRVLVRRILRKYGYPPDKQERATQTVLEQAELLARDWAA